MTFAMPVVLALVGYFIFSAAVGAMLPPLPGKERGFYGWLYRFAQRLAANADRLAEARFGKLLGADPGADPANSPALTVASTTAKSSESTTTVVRAVDAGDLKAG